jgi:PAS domain S-box-containing protein
MRLSLKAKLTLATSLLVLGVVALVSGLYLATLTRQVIRQTSDRARFVAQQVFLEAQQALNDAARRGETPASSSADDIRAYVRRILEQSSGWKSSVEGALGYTPSIYEITMTDRDGTALVSSDASLPGRQVDRRTNLATLVRAGFLDQLNLLYGPPRVYEVTLPFNLGEEPFGDIRVGISSVLLRAEISPGLRSAGWFALAAVVLSTLLATLVSQVALAPLERISTQLDRISAGESDVEPVARDDEFGLVSSKISRIGRELHDVREIFSTLRENLNQIMAGLEDGLLLFNAEGRVVLASPSAEQFLGVRASEILGRGAGDIFPEGHPLRQLLHLENDQFEPVEEAEVRLAWEGGERRVGASAQVISEEGRQMGTLLTLRDLESLERIGSELQVSERLAALGRVTAGVAHEVKNPLNSMRVWLEVLKSNLPVEPESLQAVKMLDTEIDRLDRVVKTFLDFTRPVELDFVDTDLVPLLQEALRGARPAIDRAGVELVADLPSSFPPARVDPRLIHQAVFNVVLNACEAMNPGGRLTVSLGQRGEMAEIQIADTGRGIAAEDRKKIFQLFFTTRPGGSGVGLANAYRFVQLHNGSIEFDSEVGRGTTFRIDLPLARPFEHAAPKFQDSERAIAREN